MALRRDCRQKQNKTSFSPLCVFLFSQNSLKRFWGSFLWHLWIGRARHPGPPSLPRHFGVEFLNVGGWLTHGDLAMEVGVDFLAVVQHCLIPARVRSEWSRLKRKDLGSIWALKIPPMLVMLGWVLLVCVVLPFLFLLVLLPSFGGSLTVVELFVA